ncbi:olfactory receptor 1G1-like [Bufo gargarizans]|uniref:olfactory receptor 1G1-like n=1 Tax=Bufo gargarizans TaxID=30331 RepID=UPI001CF33F14|nr:olfactory receptor 1G1-like [Bufo gargarizans]
MNLCPNGSSKHEFNIVAFSTSGQLQLFFCILIIYLITMLGNLLIIFLVYLVPKLQTPMYFLLSNLAAADVTSTSNCIPKLLSITLTWDHRISFSCCMTQLFFFLLSATGEIFILTSMAYDRFVAICKPLQYYTIMRKNVYIAMAASCWLLSLLNSLLHTLLICVLKFCNSHDINNFYCDMNSLLALSTTDTRNHKIFLFFELSVIFLVQFILIIISYIFIFGTILKIRSSGGRMKAFSSCISHLITVILFYGPSLILYMKTKGSKEKDTLLSMLYLVVVPMLNPLVYSLRNKEVWEATVMLKKKILRSSLFG